MHLVPKRKISSEGKPPLHSPRPGKGSSTRSAQEGASAQKGENAERGRPVLSPQPLQALAAAPAFRLANTPKRNPREQQRANRELRSGRRGEHMLAPTARARHFDTAFPTLIIQHCIPKLLLPDQPTARGRWCHCTQLPQMTSAEHQ